MALPQKKSKHLLMKGLTCFLFLFSLISMPVFANKTDHEIDAVINEMYLEIKSISEKYYKQYKVKQDAMCQINQELRVASQIEEKVSLLIAKDNLREELVKLKDDEIKDISKIRYLKGVQIIRLLYEKILSLDHHFASVRTFSEINKIANPNQYPEYEKLKDLIANKKDKKAGLDLTSVLGTNTIVSVVQTFSNMMVSNLSKEEKEQELANIECILDFTLRMQNDLNTIYFETAYLQNSNDKMKKDLETLFVDYTKPIGYASSLETCRTTDDWEAIKIKTNTYLANLKEKNGAELYTSQVNIVFPIDRLLQYITQYNSFIDQGGKFYEKFKIILNSYENQKQCESKLPIEYKKLKDDIDVAITKFNIAYKPIEVNGSKMKEILYGINEFD